MNRGTHIGEFEELVLLAVGILYEDAYGLAISDAIESRTGRTVTMSAVHKTLMRLEEKGYLTSEMGGATETRGGRKKRLFSLTGTGKEILKQTKEMRDSLYQAIPNPVWNFSF